jgi:Spy/CpxP family protein refolding chaperone
MRRPAAIGVVVALFLVGVAVGVLGANLVAHHRGQRSGGGGAGGGGRMPAAELQRRLDLSPDQRRQVEAILADSHHEAQVPWNEFRARLMQIVEAANDRIEKILTPAQKPEFLRYRAERHERMHHAFHGHGQAPGRDSGSAPGAPPPH